MTGIMTVDLRAHRGGFRMDATFEVAPGEIVAVIGPNGSGKSTLLDAIAGHLVSTGRLSIGSRVLHAPGGTTGAARAISLAPAERRIALLGQRALLFPHLSVLENTAFGPRAQGIPRAEARRRARARLEEVGLGAFAPRRPAELSGGQQQRAAIARALAAAPDALLLDEPFAALDAQTAAQARRLIATQRDEAGIPIVLVTHDPMVALLLASRTLVMQEGSVVQSGATAEVLGHPRSDFVAAVAGVNRLAVTGAAGGGVRAPGLELQGHGDPLREGERGTAVFAPGSVRVRAARTAPGPPAPNRWTGTVALLEPLPGGIRVHTAEQPGIAVDCPSTAAVALGLRPGLPLAFEVAVEDVSVRTDQDG
jgi:molybdate transport system ATP-binding protein